MKAAVLYKTNNPLIVEKDLTIPSLRPGQVLVKVAYSGVCHSQLMEVRGMRGEDRFLPHLLGHEGTGKVIQIGEGVKKVEPNDLVVLGWIKGTGMDVPGTIYQKGDQKINAGPVTTFNEYAVVSENRCLKLPQGVPLDVGVLFGCAVPTGSGIIINTIKPAEGSIVAIFGLGGIGLSALMTTLLYDCSQVIAVDVEDSKLILAKEFGATHIINSRLENPVEKILDITSGRGVDYSVEAAGLVETIEQAFQSIRKNGGLCVFASHPKKGAKILLDPHDLISGKQIQGSWGGNSMPDQDIPKFAKLYLDGKLPLDKLISRKYSLEQINQALEDLENRKVARALIEFE
jgi:S-(hydroxymethyl)glutathione dehydrogenase/alcohol dehydrogenase